LNRELSYDSYPRKFSIVGLAGITQLD
jgi:hypothetical protein